MILSLFSTEKKYFKYLFYPVFLLFFIYFPFITGVNSARPDYIGYVEIFHSIPALFSPGFFSELRETNIELGYAIFTSIVKFFTNSATIFFILLCFFSFVFRFRAIENFVRKEDIILVLFAFLAHEFMRKDAIQIRNGIASAILLYSFVSLHKGNKMHFCIWVFVASMFHQVALIAMPLVVINNIILNNKTIRIMQLVLVLALIGTFLFSIHYIFSVLGNIGILPRRISIYIGSRFDIPMPIYHPVILRQIILCSLILLVKKELLLASGNTAFFLFKIYFISTLYYLIFLDFELLAGRFGALFNGVEVLFLLQIIYSDAVKQKKLMKLALFLLTCTTFIMNWITFSPVLSFEMTFQ